ncbi:MAG: response regulator [Sulfuricurvum sp.]
MKKILIVDDNQNNRILLRAVLEEYAEEEGNDFLIDESTNGVEAVAQCAQESYDLILMDIMMPEMDGIEATKRIRSADSRALIVAVSAVDDTARQKEILTNGAEDYISKPINVDIFTARLGNYLALIDSRRHLPLNREAHNLYSKQIYSRTLTFFVDSEDDLAEFWEYYLLDSQTGCALLSDTVRTLYGIGSIALKLHLKISVWIEESIDFLFFTMEGLETLDPKFVKLVITKNPGMSDYRFERGKISIRVPVKNVRESKKAAEVSVMSQPAMKEAESQTTPMNEPVQFAVTDINANRIYDYMDEDDLGDIRDYIGRLNSLLLIVGSGDIKMDEVDEIAVYLDRIGKLASVYSESYSIGQALMQLSATIQSQKQEFINKSISLGTLCAAFSRDLMSWLRLIFDEGAPSVNYMDDTIVSNTQMIGSMLVMDSNTAEAADLDDIFDF